MGGKERAEGSPIDYITAVTEAQTLNTETIERPDFDRRRREIRALLKLIPNGDPEDLVGKKEAAKRVSQLLRTDPLTKQQAGAVVRFQRLLSDNYYELTQVSPHLNLTFAEEIEIHTGNFEAILDIATRYPERASVWQRAARSIITNNRPQTVYRGMWISDREAEIISRYGLIPEGLHRFNTLDNLMEQSIYSNWGRNKGNPMEKTSVVRHNLLRELIFSKVNALHEVYAAGDFGSSSPFKLGISTTTPQNFAKKWGVFFGDHILELSVPASELIVHKNEGDGEDERTIFFYTPPESILRFVEIDTKSYDPLPELFDRGQRVGERKKKSFFHFWK